MGLQLALRNSPENSEVYSTLHELMDACQASIDILNDLLLYDKLEDGEMKLERRSINAKKIITDITKSFVVQVRLLYGWVLMSIMRRYRHEPLKLR